MTKLVATAAAIVIAAVTVVGPTAHAEDTTVVTQRIKYDRADLQTPEGADRMLARISRVARRLCVDRHRAALVLRPSAAALRCQHEAVALTVATLDAPLVTAAYTRSQPSQVAVAGR